MSSLKNVHSELHRLIYHTSTLILVGYAMTCVVQL